MLKNEKRKHEDFEEGFTQNDPFDERHGDFPLPVSDDIMYPGKWSLEPFGRRECGCREVATTFRLEYCLLVAYIVFNYMLSQYVP